MCTVTRDLCRKLNNKILISLKQLLFIIPVIKLSRRTVYIMSTSSESWDCFTTALRALCFNSSSFAKAILGDLLSGDIKMEDGGWYIAPLGMRRTWSISYLAKRFDFFVVTSLMSAYTRISLWIAVAPLFKNSSNRVPSMPNRRYPWLSPQTSAPGICSPSSTTVPI